MEISCCFCGKKEDEVLIEKIHYEFSHILENLLGITPQDTASLSFICDICKDSAANFLIFKNNCSLTNPHRKMIFAQIDDFLKQIQNFEEIQVVRKLHSITLQIDNEIVIKDIIKVNKEDQEECDYGDFLMEVSGDEEEIIEQDPLKENEPVDATFDFFCEKCNEDIVYEIPDLHEFFKHSLLGIQIENDAESQEDEDSSVRKCRTCSKEFEESKDLANHCASEHLSEYFEHMNQAYGLNESSLDLIMIDKYLIHIKNLVAGNVTSALDEEAKQYFYQIYCGDMMKPAEEEFEVKEETFEDFEETHEIEEPRQPQKPSKSAVLFSSLDEESRDWVRNQILGRKCQIVNEFGISRDIYRCGYCIFHSSNSPAGFRYHLINKHLKEKSFREQSEVQNEFFVPPLKNKIGKNVCIDCNLKFKDQKLLTSHLNCHKIFETMSHYYTFPSCNTCNALYIDDVTLNLHLYKHDSKANVKKQIPVPAGAIVIQGKIASDQPQEKPDFGTDFAWSCGHCPRRFKKEEQCRYHLLMVHVPVFTCPIDKRDFSGHKAVSLFTHHLKNKHPELFPDVVFSCTFCSIEFHTIYEKLSHMKNCSEKKFECDHCQKKFFKKAGLISHLKFVSGEQYFQCKECDKKCETLSDLKIHFRYHTREKPFQCAICNKSFRTLAARAAHVEGHKTNFSYTCHCGKAFKQRHVYRRHVKSMHENELRLDSVQIILEEESS